MVRTVAERLRTGLDRFPVTERRVAHRLLADYPLAGLRSATELAREVGVSTPTVLRLVARLGLASYGDFQRALREELAAQLSSPLAKQTSVPGRRGRSLKPASAEFAEAVAGNLRDTFAHLSEPGFQQVVELLLNRRLRIHLVGGRFTDALARYLSVQLRVLRPEVSHLEGQESNWQDQLLDMGKRDVLILFDIRRYQESLLRLSEQASRRLVRIVLLTDQWLSPVARFADHVLSARVVVPSAWDSGVALLALSEALLAEATRQGWEGGRKRMRELEAIRETLDKR